jgi:GDP-fucose transporter C1
LVLGALGSLATATDTVIVKRFLLRGGRPNTDRENNSGKGDLEQPLLQLAWQTAILSLLLYLPFLVLSGQHTLLLDLLFSSRLLPTRKQLIPLKADIFHKAILSGVASTLLNIITLSQIDITSPTTHMVVSAARGVAQSLLAVLVLGEVATSGRAVGMVLVLGGSVVYGWAREREARESAGREVYAMEKGMTQEEQTN